MPYKDFTVGQILTSAEVDIYLMQQAVMVFDDAASRGSALGTAVTEGMVTYLKDTDALQQYNGTVWSPVGQESYITTGQKRQYLISNGTAGVAWENQISPFMLLGV